MTDTSKVKALITVNAYEDQGVWILYVESDRTFHSWADTQEEISPIAQELAELYHEENSLLGWPEAVVVRLSKKPEEL